MSDEGSVAAIIVNYNGGEMLRQAISSLRGSDYEKLRIIVVDNHSSDASVAMIRGAFPEVELLENATNEGFGKGCNRGIAHAVRHGDEFVLFLNCDATLAPDAITALVTHAHEHPRAVAVAPFIFYADRRDLIWFGGGIVALWRGRIAHRHLRKPYVEGAFTAEQSDYLTGCALFAYTKHMSELNGFDERYSLYAEDVDLSLRLATRGELWVTPAAKAYHHVSAFSGGAVSPFKAFHRGRSSFLLVRKFARTWEWPTLITGGILGGCFVSLRLLLCGNIKTATAIWRGIWSGLRNGGIPNEYRLGA